ncbi:MULTISPECIES: hypothetical protein [Bradyrhizobium]
MDSRNFDIFHAAPPASVQHAVGDEQQPNQGEQYAFERQLDAARVAVPAGPARRPGRKPPPNVSRADYHYIHEMMSGVSTRRKLAPLTAEKYVQMLYKVANYLGERGQSLEASDDNALNQLSDTVFKENKHVGIALRALQEQRGGSSVVRVRRVRAAAPAGAGRTPIAATEADAPLIESVINEGIKRKHWTPPTAQHHHTTLRKLSKSLATRRETLAGTSDDALHEYIQEAFPENWKRMTGSLGALREHRREGRALEGGPFASDGVERAESMAAAGSSSSDLIPNELYQLLVNDLDESSVVAETPELLSKEQELREQIAVGPESTSLPLPVLGEELRSYPEGSARRPEKRRRVLDGQFPHSLTAIDPGRLALSPWQFVPAERPQLLDELARFNPVPFADDAAGPIDPEALIFATLPLSPGELSRLLDNEPMPPQPNQLADEAAGAADAKASVIAPPSFSPGELWRLLDDDSMTSAPDRFSVPINSDVFNFASLPLSSDEPGRLLDAAPAPGRADPFTGQSPNCAAGSDTVDMPFSPGELRALLDDHPAPIAINQPGGNLPVSADPDRFILNQEQMPPGELRRLLDDEPAS